MICMGCFRLVVSVATYSFLDGAEFLELLSQSRLFGVPGQAADTNSGQLSPLGSVGDGAALLVIGLPNEKLRHLEEVMKVSALVSLSCKESVIVADEKSPSQESEWKLGFVRARNSQSAVLGSCARNVRTSREASNGNAGWLDCDS
jgi:hypothetical protein